MRAGSLTRGALFALQFVLLDALLHGAARYATDPARALGSLASFAIWGLVFSLRDRRAPRVAGAAVAGLVLAVDAWVYRFYGTPLDGQVVASALHNRADVLRVGLPLLPWMGLAWVAASAGEYAWLGGARSGWESRARAPLAALAVLGLARGRLDAATPDLRALVALSTTGAAHAAPATGGTRAEGTPLPSSRTELPSVLVILTESVRASDYCGEPLPGCAFTPELDRVLPDRVALRQMRAVASYTAVSAAALLTGRTQEGSREELSVAPTLFDEARRVRAGGSRLAVAYWSAQSATVLERDVRGSVDSFMSLETLLGHAIDDEDDLVPLGVDRLLLARLSAELPRLPRPFVLVLHLAGTHAPYFVDPDRAPFRPFSHVVTWSGLPELHSAYDDAIVEHDRTVAASVAAFRASQGDAPWLILFTSDHGEAFGEHGAIHHGQSLYDEQIHVPAWIASGGGALDAEARAGLLAHRDAFVTHLDVLPTVLDALGVWRGLAMAGDRARLPGRSLFEPEAPRAPVPVTNCTGLFPCPLDTWGVLDGDHALVAQPWDGDWSCVDLARSEEHAHGARCDALREASRRFFPRLPNGSLNAR